MCARGMVLGSVLALATVVRAADCKSQVLNTPGLNRPVFVCSPPGDTDRLFIVEQTGKIQIYKNSTGTLNATPFFTFPMPAGFPASNPGEDGLLGLAFHPNYSTNGYFYVRGPSGAPVGSGYAHRVYVRYRVSSNPDVADPASAKTILDIATGSGQHNGGWMAFGPDGYLYTASGDPGGSEQDRTSLLGKILRIDVDGGDPYGIPASNPYKGSNMYRQEIWAFGLRNPWRCSFDRQTGDLWIGDVGESTREEIDVIPAGSTSPLNFGYPYYEGFIQQPGYTGPQPVTAATFPIIDLDRTMGRSVIGGYVYRGAAIPALQGMYFFADNGYVNVRSLVPNVGGGTYTNLVDRTAELNAGRNPAFSGPSSFGEDAAGELYICDVFSGTVSKIVPLFSITTSSPLSAWTQGAVGYSVSFASTGGVSPITWSVSAGTLPPGLTLSSSGVLSGTPSAAGAFSFTVQAKDASSNTTTSVFALTVNAALTVTTASPLPAANTGIAYSQTFAATGGTGAQTWTISSGTLPTGVTLSSAGVLAGTPTQTGAFNFTVRVADTVGASATKAVALTVNNTLTITSSSPLPGWTRTRAYSQTLSASGGVAPYTWTVSAGALPAGLTLSTAGVISGTPTTVGTSNFTAQVADASAGSATKTFALTISDLPAITTASPLPGGNTGAAYVQALAASGGTAPLSWSLSAGTLPAGLTLSAAGVISGTPTTASTSSFTALVTDAAGAATSQAYSLTISSAPTITSTAVTSGNIGALYTYAVVASGSPASTFSLTGTLPTGMTINAASGIVSWTPTAAGSFAVTVQAANGTLPNASQTFTITVTDYGLTSRLPLTAYLNMPPDVAGSIPAILSTTGVFSNTATLTPNSNIIPFNVNSPLWSDGAYKNRWIALPTGQTITFAPTGEWTFPAGTVLIKHFELGVDDTNPAVRKRLETRLLVLGANNAAYGVTYKWNAAGTDADLLTNSLSEDIPIATGTGANRTQTWYYPSRGDCMSCHTANAGLVLGVKTRQLNGSCTYPATGVTDNQLRTWSHIGMFSAALNESAISTYDKLVKVGDTTAPLVNRVRSYFDANCCQCHRPGGAPADFDMRYDTPLASQFILDIAVRNTLGIANAKVIAKGNQARSIALVRTNTVGANQMPPLARNTIDSEAVNAIRAWLESYAAAPSGLTATAVSPTQINLAWALNGDNETAVLVERSMDGATGWTQVLSPGAAAKSAADTGLTPNTTYYYRVRAQVSSGDSALSNVASATVSGGTAAIYQINCGGGAAAPFAADAYFSGNVGGYGRGSAIDTSGVSNPAPQAVYQCYSYSSTSMTYTFPGLTAGVSYQVRLHFAALYYSAVGQDKFNVSINGQAVLSNFDVVAAAGGQYKAIVKEFTAAANGSGQLAITFTSVVNEAQCNGIEICSIVNGAPSITTQPASQTVTAGQSATFSVVASGTAPLNYQWTKNGANITGATSSSYTTPATAAGDNGALFAAIVSNSVGSVTSSNAMLTVNAPNQPPVIQSSPWANPNPVTLPSTTTVNVVATDPDGGPSPLTYTWSQVSGPAGVGFSPNGTTGSSSSAATFTAAGSYVLRVTVSDGAASVTGDVSVTVNPAQSSPPAITSATSASGTVGTAFSYTITATNSPTSYNATGLPAGLSVNTSTGVISGTPSAAANSNVTISATNVGGTGSATLSLTINGGGTTAIYQINCGGGAAAPFAADAYFSGNVAGYGRGNAIDTSGVSNPAPQAVYQCYSYSNTSMTYTFPGLTAGVSYQVRLHFAALYYSAVGQDKFNVSINGQAVLSNFDVVAAAGGQNKAIVKEFTVAANGSGQLAITFTSVVNEAQCNGIEICSIVNGAPSIITQPASQTVTAGQSATFSVVASGTAPLNYQWTKNGANITGATSSSYTTPATAAGDNGALFAVIVSNSAGSVASSNATLTVNAAPVAPSITTQPASQTVTAGQSATFSVVASGTAPLNYQWTKNGANIAVATSSSYTTPATAAGDNGALFAVIVSNSAGSVTSSNATLTVSSGSGSGTAIYQINCGGGAAAPFAADAYFSGNVGGYGRGNAIDTSGVSNPAPQAVYQRYSYSNTNMTYTFPGLTAGVSYQVRLHFAALYYSAVGQDKFNVSINGQAVLSNFDVVAAAGGQNKAIVKEFTVAANGSGQLAITFTSVVNEAQCNGIEIYSIAQSAISASETAPLRNAMKISRVMGSAMFVQGGHDSISFSGTIFSVPKLFDPAGKTLAVNYAGATQAFTLDERGKSNNTTGAASLKVKRNKTTKRMEFQGGNVPFSIKLQHGTWAGAWGLDPNASVSTTMNMTTTITLNGVLYSATTSVKYKSKAKAGGKFMGK